MPTAPPVIERLYECPGCKRRRRSTMNPSIAGHWCSGVYLRWEVVQ